MSFPTSEVQELFHKTWTMWQNHSPSPAQAAAEAQLQAGGIQQRSLAPLSFSNPLSEDAEVLDISESVSETLHRSYLFWRMSAFYLPKNPSLLPFACSCHREKVKLLSGQVTHFCCYLTHIFDFFPSHCQDNAQKLRNRKIHCCKWKVEELVDVSWKARFI